MKNNETIKSNIFFEIELSTEKLIKNIVIATTLLTTLNTSDLISNKDKEPVKAQKVELSPDLKYISEIESNSGKNKKHKLIRYGLNKGHRAAGATGLMPLTIKEVIKKDASLSKKYISIVRMDPKKITIIVNQDEQIEKEVANSHWKRLTKLFPKNEKRRAYAWKNGVTGALRASEKQVSEHPYVKKFINLKYNKSREF